MEIVLNEVKYAEEIIESGTVGKKPASTIFLLSKYYRHVKHLNKSEIIGEINAFMHNNLKGYNPAKWETLIENIVEKTKKSAIRGECSIGISKNELDVIHSVGNIQYEKLLFTMLCFAKFYNMNSEQNDNWVNMSIKDIYKSSRVAVRKKEEKFLFLNDLEQSGYISFSKKNDNLNIQVMFVDDGEPALLIDDFRELGYEYMNYVGYDNFMRCSRCGILIKKTGNKLIYCSECAKKVKLQQNKQYREENRNCT